MATACHSVEERSSVLRAWSSQAAMTLVSTSLAPLWPIPRGKMCAISAMANLQRVTWPKASKMGCSHWLPEISTTWALSWERHMAPRLLTGHAAGDFEEVGAELP